MYKYMNKNQTLPPATTCQNVNFFKNLDLLVLFFREGCLYEVLFVNSAEGGTQDFQSALIIVQRYF